jgi:hypothetical protein
VGFSSGKRLKKSAYDAGFKRFASLAPTILRENRGFLESANKKKPVNKADVGQQGALLLATAALLDLPGGGL